MEGPKHCLLCQILSIAVVGLSPGEWIHVLPMWCFAKPPPELPCAACAHELTLPGSGPVCLWGPWVSHGSPGPSPSEQKGVMSPGNGGPGPRAAPGAQGSLTPWPLAGLLCRSYRQRWGRDSVSEAESGLGASPSSCSVTLLSLLSLCGSCSHPERESAPGPRPKWPPLGGPPSCSFRPQCRVLITLWFFSAVQGASPGHPVSSAQPYAPQVGKGSLTDAPGPCCHMLAD